MPGTFSRSEPLIIFASSARLRTRRPSGFDFDDAILAPRSEGATPMLHARPSSSRMAFLSIAASSAAMPESLVVDSAGSLPAMPSSSIFHSSMLACTTFRKRLRMMTSICADTCA